MTKLFDYFVKYLHYDTVEVEINRLNSGNSTEGRYVTYLEYQMTNVLTNRNWKSH